MIDGKSLYDVCILLPKLPDTYPWDQCQIQRKKKKNKNKIKSKLKKLKKK